MSERRGGGLIGVGVRDEWRELPGYLQRKLQADAVFGGTDCNRAPWVKCIHSRNVVAICKELSTPCDAESKHSA